MTLTFKYEAPISEFQHIPAGTVVSVIEYWNEYEGFTAIEYKGQGYYFNSEHFVELAIESKLTV